MQTIAKVSDWIIKAAEQRQANLVTRWEFPVDLLKTVVFPAGNDFVGLKNLNTQMGMTNTGWETDSKHTSFQKNSIKYYSKVCPLCVNTHNLKTKKSSFTEIKTQWLGNSKNVHVSKIMVREGNTHTRCD